MGNKKCVSIEYSQLPNLDKPESKSEKKGVMDCWTVGTALHQSITPTLLFFKKIITLLKNHLLIKVDFTIFIDFEKMNCMSVIWIKPRFYSGKVGVNRDLTIIETKLT